MTAPLTAPVPWQARPVRGEEGMATLYDANGNPVAIGPKGEDAMMYARVAEFVVAAVGGAENTPQTYLSSLLGLHSQASEEEASDYDESVAD